MVAAIMDNTGPRVMEDSELNDFFVEMDEAAGIRGRQLGVDLLCELTGGPCFYIGPEWTVLSDRDRFLPHSPSKDR